MLQTTFKRLFKISEYGNFYIKDDVHTGYYIKFEANKNINYNYTVQELRES